MENAILTSYEEKRKQSFATFHTTVFELLPALIAEIKKRHEKVGKGETVSSPLADVELETWRQIDKITSTAANILAICSNGATSVLANSSAGYTHLVHANMAVPAHKMLDAKVAIVVNLARECHEFYADLSVTVEDIYPSITSGVDMHTQVFDSIRTMLEEILSQLRGIIEYCLTRNKERCEYITGVADKMKVRETLFLQLER